MSLNTVSQLWGIQISSIYAQVFSWSAIVSGLSGTPAWVAPIVQDPISANTYYCGYQNVFKSTNQGNTWTIISNFNTTLDEIKVSPLNPNIIFATSTNAIWKTSNGGTTWSNITPTNIIGLNYYVFHNLFHFLFRSQTSNLIHLLLDLA